MAIELEIRDWQKRHLTSLLKIKRAGAAGQALQALIEELENAVTVMEPEDVAYCEKIIGVKAF